MTQSAEAMVVKEVGLDLCDRVTYFPRIRYDEGPRRLKRH
jgi:hypothetical protein